MVVWSVNVQNMQDRAPRITSVLRELWSIMAFNTYSGDVPISPYTIPRVIINPAAVMRFIPESL
jgi:hypothetical protein